MNASEEYVKNSPLKTKFSLGLTKVLSWVSLNAVATMLIFVGFAMINCLIIAGILTASEDGTWLGHFIQVCRLLVSLHVLLGLAVCWVARWAQNESETGLRRGIILVHSTVLAGTVTVFFSILFCYAVAITNGLAAATVYLTLISVDTFFYTWFLSIGLFVFFRLVNFFPNTR